MSTQSEKHQEIVLQELRRVVRMAEMSQAEIERRTGAGAKLVSRVIHGKAPVTLERIADWLEVIGVDPAMFHGRISERLSRELGPRKQTEDVMLSAGDHRAIAREVAKLLGPDPENP